MTTEPRKPHSLYGCPPDCAEPECNATGTRWGVRYRHAKDTEWRPVYFPANANGRCDTETTIRRRAAKLLRTMRAGHHGFVYKLVRLKPLPPKRSVADRIAAAVAEAVRKERAYILKYIPLHVKHGVRFLKNRIAHNSPPGEQCERCR